MFTRDDVPCVIGQVVFKQAENEDGKVERVAHVTLTLDPCPVDVLSELGEDVADLVTRERVNGAAVRERVLRQDVTKVALRIPGLSQQTITVRPGQAAPPAGTLQHVRVGVVTLTRKADKRSEWLALTVVLDVPLDARAHRDLLAAMFGEVAHLTFVAEQPMLDALSRLVPTSADSMTISVPGQEPVTITHDDVRRRQRRTA